MRIAQRESGTLTWIITDHLGSTTALANEDGTLKTLMRYTAFGEIRKAYGSDQATDYRYTGQRSEGEIGLYFYVSRFYDPALGRFIQPDSVIPGLNDKKVPYNAYAWDRYNYANNNLLKYVDSSGHFPILAFLIVLGATILFSQIPSDQIQQDPANWGDPMVMGVGGIMMMAPAAIPPLCSDGDCTNEVQASIKIGNTAIEKVTKIGKITSQLMSKAKLLGIQVSQNMSDLTNAQVQKGLKIINDISSSSSSRIFEGTWKQRAVYEYILNGVGVVRDRFTGELITILERGEDQMRLLQEFVDKGTGKWLR